MLVAEKLGMALHSAYVLLLVWSRAAENTQQGCCHKCYGLAYAKHDSR